MGSVRIRWRGVARVVAVVFVGLIGLRLLPGLLRAPEPPPLAADVGLPRTTAAEAAPVEPAAKPRSRPRRTRSHRKARSPRKTRPRIVSDAPAATAVIGTRRRHRKAKKSTKPRPQHGIALESTPPRAPEYVPAPPPEPTPELPPAPVPAAPAPPGDGSEEFAPH